MKPLLLVSILIFLLARTTASEASEKLPPKVEARLERVQNALDALDQSNSSQVVLSNSAGSEVTINLRDDDAQPWETVRLAAGQTIALNHSQIISLLTKKSDGTVHDQSYRAEGGYKYVIYWNQEFWDMIRVENETEKAAK